MRSIESEGESIDEAIDNALKTLGADRDQVEVEILSDSSRGLFGFGGKKARVRATMRAPLVSRLADSAAEPPANDSRETSIPLQGSAATGQGHVSASDVFQARCKALLSELLSHLGATCIVEARAGEEAGSVLLDVRGDGGGLLIGRRGQTLDAIEYMMNRMVARDGQAVTARVVVDVERYRERRQEYLLSLAHRLADKVRRTGRTVTLNPMSPRDRRIIHLALHDDASVITRSDGDGHFRKVLILPQERPRRGPRRTEPAG